eukprot:GHVT01053768.1.p1 GENE.GHVT01053768.1~~GHVT01053768.1.p1  ORF type:complete len:105 (+),score=5.56 GHVT01053768.1:132-446(+)
MSATPVCWLTSNMLRTSVERRHPQQGKLGHVQSVITLHMLGMLLPVYSRIYFINNVTEQQLKRSQQQYRQMFATVAVALAFEKSGSKETSNHEALRTVPVKQVV